MGGSLPAVNAGPYGPNPPGAPTGTTATNSGSTAIDVAWTAPADNGGAAITNYEVYRSTSSGAETFLTETGNALSYHDASVTLGTTYFYRIAAKNSAGIGAQSNEASAKAANAPGQVTSLTVTPINGHKGFTLAWTNGAANGDNIVNVLIYRCDRTASSTCTPALTYTDPLETGRTDNTGLTNSHVYAFQVSDKNGVGEGTKSAVVTGTN